ncbi:hypothetical protein QZH41_012683, partial [Actinostola sp. cb2023]
RLVNESTLNQQDAKRQKLSQTKNQDPISTDVTLSSTTLTKLKTFEMGSKYFDSKDTNNETKQDEKKTEKDTDDCIIIDDEMESSTSNFDVSCFSRKTSTDLPSTNAQSKEKSPTSSVKTTNQRTKSQYTPLELQFIDIKAKYNDAVLFVECGYKYKFFGEDAEIASKELNIMCFMNHNFMVASIPTHRLHVHVKRLVSKGYKVGVVKQTETAALKAASDNKSNVFTRELSALYTKSTLIGEDMRVADGNNDGSESDMIDTSSAYLMCLYEYPEPGNTNRSPVSKTANEESTTYGFVAVQPSTGAMIFDEFQDTPGCSELETRLQHIGIAELLIPDSLSRHTKNFIKLFASQAIRPEDAIRIEEIPNKHFSHEAALKVITDFTEEMKNGDRTQGSVTDKDVETTIDDSSENTLLQRINNLPQNAQICYAVLTRYLKDFKLDRVLRLSSNFVRFSNKRQCMKLDGCTVKNLELFKNEQGSEQCTLFWVLNHTSTNFGKRLLKKWISQPLKDSQEIESRLASVSEILSSNVQCLRKMKALLARLPDLERGLCCIYSKKCSTGEFLTILKALISLYEMVNTAEHEATRELSSSILLKTFTEIPTLLNGTDKFLKMIDEEAARMGDKTKLFRDEAQFPNIQQCTTEMQRIVGELKVHRSSIRRTILHPSIDYCTVAGNEFLIEVRNAKLGSVPADWIKINSTKQVCRFRTPFVEEHYKLLCQQREVMSRVCNEAWIDYLEMFNQRYTHYHKAVQLVAIVDCLVSLATVAKQPGYSCPIVKDSETELQITQGRHPILDTVLSENEQYVPNDTNLKRSGVSRSSQRRHSYHGYFVIRMGASDNIYKGRSTFMVELQEAACILNQATSRSLVILDELGRGTSTHDGIAVAYATLYHIIAKIGSLTMFVTHYPNIAEIEKSFPEHVTNNHMAFMTSQDSAYQSPTEEKTTSLASSGKDDDVKHCGTPSVTFLYRLVKGVAERSYGLNVARLAGIPRDILAVASGKSCDLEIEITSRRSVK